MTTATSAATNHGGTKRSATRGSTTASIAAKTVTVLVLTVGIYNNFHSISFNPFAPAAGDSSRSVQFVGDNTENLRIVSEGNCSGSESILKTPRQSSQSTRPSFSWNGTILQDTCYYVEDICHTSHRWFYRTSPNPEKRRLYQPEVLLHYEQPDLRTYVGDIESAYEATYRFRHLSNHSNLMNTLRCVDSTVTNHLVLYSLYNEMLGEFYDRSLLFLWLLSKEHEWVRHAQLYLHLYMPNRRLLDSHHLFTNPFRTMPLMDFATLMDETSCQCLPRLIFCGYDVEEKRSEKKNRRKSSLSQKATSATSAQKPVLIELTPSDDILMAKPNRKQHQMFQRDLRQSLILNNPHVQEDIEAFRTSMLNDEKIPIAERDSWRIVGLTQRSSRRVWRNLTAVMTEASAQLRAHKILLVEVNVERDGFSPYQHVVWHAALDGLVGIHGAQLTDAVWMKPGSWVIELLPYVPDKIIMGRWTKTTDGPTPLGEIFDGTDLNHAGHPLGRDSAPYCYGLEGFAYQNCWTQKRNPWDKRDFLVESQALVKVLLGTVALSSAANTTTRCQDYQERGAKKDGVIVMYNVHCAKEKDGVLTLNHFYW